MLSRLLTPKEHAAVKGIPESAVDGLSDKTAHEILGQSVLFPVFRSLGRLIGKAFDTLDRPAAPQRACSEASLTWTPSLF
jgi:hypothetical protein